MEHRTRLAEEIQLTEAQALYDASCKRLLSNKIFLAWILKNCLEEYKDCDVETIRDQYIEGVPAVGEVAVHPDQTNAQLGAGQSIMGLNTEDKRLTEGQINYDIRFFALAPQDGSQVRIIVNVEAQNKYNPGYPLVKRGLYYASRMISAQYSEEFEKSEYGKLKKVCSIWICLNAEKERRNSITRYALREERVVGQGGEKFETTHEVAAKERHRKKPSKRDGEKRREEKLRGRKRVVSENKAATAQKGKALRHGKGFRGR